MDAKAMSDSSTLNALNHTADTSVARVEKWFVKTAIEAL
jgi:hypothetical protein